MNRIFLTALTFLITFYCQSQGNIGCWAGFNYTQNGNTTIFTDNSFVAPADPWSNNYSLSWAWDFGDGTTSNLQNPTHIYSNGTYIVCLTLTMFDMTVQSTCTSTHCDSIIGVSTPPSWDCDLSLGCYDPGTGNGQYTSLSSCHSVCNSTSVREIDNNKKLIKTINILGLEKKEEKNDLLFYIYDDGSVIKKIIIE